MLERKLNPSALGFPSIAIPDDHQADEYGRLTFKLETARGGIQVVCSRHGLKCIGNFDALTAYGLLRADWLPGIPGNNKLRQTVIFGADGPRLVLGNRRGSKIDSSHVVIVRESVHRYAVIVPLTAEQKKFLDEQMRTENEKRTSRETLKRMCKPAQSPGEMRYDCVHLFDTAMLLNDARLAEAGFHYEQDSKDRINKAYGELRRALAEGGIVQSSGGLKCEGNVVYLNCAPKH